VSRGLSKAGIVQAALGVLDEAGFDGLTVRAVAAALGVKAPALYWHVRDKQELIDEMATEVWRQVVAELTALPGDWPWDRVMTEFAMITRRALLAHRDGARVFSGTYLTDPGVLKAQERGLEMMTGAGFTLASVVRAYSLLYNFIVGFCIEEQSVAQAIASGDERYSLERRAERVDQQAHPLVVESGPEIFGDPDARFADLVAVIVDAASRMRTAP
jgi:TetR/AcrR family transcriptional regulator, tetracycline repressor protein